jgi:hypothetical protein
MDREALTKKMKALYKKAADARQKGKRDIARAFANGAARVQRELKRTAPKTKKGDAAAKPDAAAPAAPAAQ